MAAPIAVAHGERHVARTHPAHLPQYPLLPVTGRLGRRRPVVTMPSEREQLEAGIAAIEAQRTLLGDSVVDALLAPAREKLASLHDDAAGPRPTQQLKQVSILFLDVVGSTTLSQHLDPEEIGVVMDDALARATTVVAAHRGRVLQYAGDNLLAAFGVDEAREDDPEHAVRAGLELLVLGRTLGAEVQAQHGDAGFDVRIGIHTGGVLLGGGVDADGTIRGIAVNIAARMEQSAPAGALRISHDTYAQVRGLFEVDVQAPMIVKGVDEPVQSYLVVKPKPRSFRLGTRGIEGVVTRMIGRDAELEDLQTAFRTLLVDRAFAAVTIVAEAGIGKSRLLYEFAAWSEARPEPFLLFRGRADPQTQGQPYGLLRDILAWRFRIADDDTVETARRKMEDGIVPLFVDDDGPDLAEGHAHLLGHLIGIEWKDSRHIEGIVDDPKQIRNRAFHAAVQLFRRISVQDGVPIVLQLEDLHWADGESLDFLAHLAAVDRDVPILVVASSRPTLFERRAGWCADDVHRRIDLLPLDRSWSLDLANELLKKIADIPAALRELLTGGSEGNPFYMEELVKMLIDQKAIETGNVWKVNATRLLVTKVPATLTGVLQARLDSLAAAERNTLQTASVIGQVFWDKALAALDAQSDETLPKLVMRALTVPRSEASSEDLREYAFKHAILHQVTYATVLKRTRKGVHGKLAHWLAAQTGLRANDFLAIAAGHFEEAEDDANAAEFYARAAEQAQQRMAYDAVHANVRRGLARLESMPDHEQRPLRWRLLAAREAALNMQGEREAQRADIDALERLADERNDDRSKAQAALKRSFLGMRTADHAVMLEYGRRAASWAGRAGDVELRLRAQRQVAFGLADQGDHEEGRRLANQVLAEAVEHGLHQIAGSCHNALAVIADMQGDLVAALESAEQALLADQASRNRQNEAIDRANVGAGWLLLGDADRVRVESEEGLRLIRANGDRAMECVPLCNLSTVALWQGDPLRAVGLARSARDTAASVQATQLEVFASLRVGDAELALGHDDAALEAFGRARARAEEIDSPLRYDADAGSARTALSRADVDAAMSAIEPVLAADRGDASGHALHGADHPRWIELTCFEVLDRAGDASAIDWLRRAHDALMEQAARIRDDRIRAGLLSNIPHHREIVARWTARSSA